MSNNGGFSSSRVSIPNSVRKTIQNIKEITHNHTEEDIYAMLKECSMDPNETTQRLLHLDAFHEVKSKRDKRKEVAKTRSGEEPRWKPGHQGRGMRGGRGNSSSQYNSADAGLQRNSFTRKNAVEDGKERGFRNPHAEKSLSISVNGQVKLPNGFVVGPDAKPSRLGDGYSKDTIVSGADSFSTIRANTSAEHAPSASDPVLVSLGESRNPSADGATKEEVRIQQTSYAAIAHIPVYSKTETSSNLNQSDSRKQDGSEASLSMVEKEASDSKNIANSVDLRAQAENYCDLNGASLTKLSSLQGVEEAALRSEKLKFSQRQHVIIPDHIQVPDAVKNALNFGSIDASFLIREKNVKSESVEALHPFAGSAIEEATNKLSSCDNDTVTIASQAEHTNHPECQSHLSEIPFPVDTKVSSAPNSEDDNPKADNFSAIGPPFPIIGTAPSYSFAFMPPMLPNTLVQAEGVEPQTHASSSLSGSVPVVSASSPPPPTQPAGAGQSSVASPQLIPLFRQPYPPNFFPYSHYYSPLYVPPTMHQYYGHAGFPAPVPTGNVFLPPPSPATGMKASPLNFKPGASAWNQMPSAIPSGYGSYSTLQVGYGPNAVSTSGNANTSEDLMPNGLKDNNIYPGQQSDGTGSRPAAAGRDTASFPVNSFMNLHPQGQPVIGPPQSTHGAFAVYHTLQPMGTPAPGLPLLPQSQPVVGPVEVVGPPPNAYQQSQRQPQRNWHS